MSANIKIFVCHHKAGEAFKSEFLVPIHAGKAGSALELGFPGDDLGGNISHKNKTWCELTVQYWMWKNVQADYYGLFHYRRYLNFRETRETDIFDRFGADFVAKYGYDHKTIESICADYDIITPPAYNNHPPGLPSTILTGYEFYARSHYAKDLDIVIDLVKAQTPAMYPSLLSSLARKQSSFWNMFIMRADLFHEYSQWLFTILFAAEKIINIDNYDSYQQRIWGFIGERLFNAYVEHASLNKSARVTRRGLLLGILDFKPVSPEKVLKAIDDRKQDKRKFLVEEPVNLVFAVDEKYVPHCAAAIASILDYVNERQKLRIFILHNNDITTASMDKLRALVKTHAPAELEFPYIDAEYFKSFIHNRPHVSVATYYRLKLHSLLPESIERIIYLDSDIIVTDNIARLWVTDMGDNYLAGALDEGGLSQSRRLNLPEAHKYINAGICIFNLKKIRQIDADTLYLETLYKNFHDITLQDQDILNIAYVNGIKIIPLRWNANSRLYVKNDLDYAYSAPEAYEAATDPAIIHYTDRSKPWHGNCFHPLRGLYFKYLKKAGWKLNKKAYYKPWLFSYFVEDGVVAVYICRLKFKLKRSRARKIYELCKLLLPQRYFRKI